MPRESDTDFLKRQAADAARTIVRSAGRAAIDARGLLSVRPWAREYPLASVGAAAAAGFVVGVRRRGSARFRVPDECRVLPRRRPMITTFGHVLAWGVMRRLVSRLLRESVPTDGDVTPE